MKTCPACGAVTFTALPYPTTEQAFYCNACGHKWGSTDTCLRGVEPTKKEAVNHPSHYTQNLEVNVECIMFTRNLDFNLGNAFKYVWRAGYKDAITQDIEKALWYLNDAIKYHLKPERMPELVCFLPKTGMEQWKYEILSQILEGFTLDARNILVRYYNQLISPPPDCRKAPASLDSSKC